MLKWSLLPGYSHAYHITPINSIIFTSGLISGLFPVVFLVESITLIDSWIGREIDEIIFSLEHFSSGDSIHLKYISHK